MRNNPSARLEAGRIRDGAWASDASYGMCGAFYIKHSPIHPPMLVIASDGRDNSDPALAGWEHVSVSHHDRTPTWEEMCFVRDLFWRDDERVVQFHPPKSEYVNVHKHCLHLWRHVSLTFPSPPSILVGPKLEKTSG